MPEGVPGSFKYSHEDPKAEYQIKYLLKVYFQDPKPVLEKELELSFSQTKSVK